MRTASCPRSDFPAVRGSHGLASGCTHSVACVFAFVHGPLVVLGALDPIGRCGRPAPGRPASRHSAGSELSRAAASP